MPEGDKQHEPTPRRREQAREEGQVARSQDLAAAIVLLVAVVLLMTLGRELAETMFGYARHALGSNLFFGQYESSDDLFQLTMSFYHDSTMRFIKPLAIVFLILVGAAVAANIAQIGFLWLPNKLAFDITKLDPIKGFGRIFSMQSLMRFLMGVVKLVIVAAVAYFSVIGEIDRILDLTEYDDRTQSAYILWLILLIALKAAVALVIIALLDFMYQWWKHEQDLRMTTEELREEMKSNMGNPEVISRRKQLQREMARQRNGQAVPQSDVVVTNPTELAIALKYEPETMAAPIVTAKGADFLAKQIRRLALEHGVPIVERKPLARALFQTVEVGDAIPPEHYAAVAEILAYVYNLKHKTITPGRKHA